MSRLDPVGTGIGIKLWSDAVYERPDPKRVAELFRSHGFEACKERWFFIPEESLRHIVIAGAKALKSTVEA